MAKPSAVLYRATGIVWILYQLIPTTQESHWLPKPAASEKSNEIKAIPRLIDKINISGKIVVQGE